MRGKCDYWQKCRLFERCIVCSELEGFAYGHRAGGCYRDIAKYGEKSTYFKIADKPVQNKELVMHPA